MAVVSAMAPAFAQEAAGSAPTRVVSLNAVEDNAKCPKGAGPCWDLQTIVANGGDKVEMIIVLGGAQPHDFHVTVGGQELKVPNAPASSGTYFLNFTLPATIPKDGIPFFCNVHKATMNGKIKAQSDLGAVEAAAVPEVGVHFLAYWVGVIAFMLLFLVYGLTFFLFKYNETPATTDHWDRAGEGAENPRMRGGRASLVALGLALLIVIAVVAAARYLR